MADTLPLARTNAEARLYVSLQPCPACGETRCTFRSSVISVDDVLASRYTGECPGCGQQRVYEFRLPEEILPPPAGAVRFGAENPSELLDPGVWLWYSDVCARQVPASTAGLDDRAVRAARHTLATAVAAVEETLKFLPATADRIPAQAFTSREGRTTYTREPGRFTRPRLEALRDTYATALSAW
ncbi:hypothetical protein D7D52_28295 [Nocardia yunnanensis]|uniref:Uncharacterized protein n=1 Tax=Nocardia yunnanensis TaxID=2382165 RepID=A0A386ZIV6_9NOCA|nr:hypothetical protein [Nocardia yunnanensis]AYF77064.1 hypothetical protein D7D52_28295 [Nocardia yunnanensis]